VPNIETLIPVNHISSNYGSNAKQLTQKKIDSNLFTLYRQSQNAKKKNSTNRFETGSILNNSTISVTGGGHDYSPGAAALTVGQSSLVMNSTDNTILLNQIPMASTASRFYNSNAAAA
jgi:hypothetical protein